MRQLKAGAAAWSQRETPVILPMRRDDVAAVCEIAQVAFPVPWTAEEFCQELAREFAVVRVLRPGPQQAISGFLNYWLLGDEAQIMNLATHPSVRRRGYARALLLDAIGRLRSGAAVAITLEVRRSNREAIALYASLGFGEAGLRPRYYSDNLEDGLIMRLDL